MSYTHNPENPWLFSRLINPWRCSSNENSRLLVTEVIVKFIHTEISKESRRRKRKPEDYKRFLKAIEANISKANVYRYFESREDLFLQLTLEASGKWREVLLN